MVPFEISHAFFSSEGKLRFLNIELPEKDLKTIEEKTRIISDCLDKIDANEQAYYLNVYSSGTEKDIDIKDLEKHVDEYVLVKLKKHYLEKDIWEGTLLNVNEIQITLSINNKGRLQKLKIDKEQIKEIKITAKLTKEK